MRICDIHLLLPDTVNDTLQQMEDDDFNVDMFLIYEEMTSFNGKSPPQPTSESVKTRFGRNSEYFFQTKCTFAQKYQLHCSYLLELPRNMSKASFFLSD